MNYLTLNLTNADLVLSDNSSWKNLNTWLDGGTSYSDYYNASNCGDYWFADVHWINIDSTSAYLTFTIEYEFINAIATYSGLCQIKFDGFADGGVAVIADTTGLNVLTDSTSKHINCDYSNANIKIDITANLLTKEITTYIHKDQAPLAKVVSSSNYSFTKFLIQAGSRANSVYKLPTITKLLNVSVSDDAISYSNFSETRSFNYIDKHGLSEVWANIKNWVLAHIGNGTLTIQKNGTDVTTFSANSSSNATANITVPTKVSDLTNDSGFLTTANIPSKTSDLVNDSGFLTSHQSLSNYVTLDSNQTLTSTKSFTTNIDTANTATTSRESWRINFTKDDTNGSGAVQIGTIQFANTGNFCTLMRVANPRSANKPTSGDDVNTGNCWSGIGVSYDFSLNKGYPYAYGCSKWADSSNDDAQLASTSWVRRYCETTKGFLTSHQSLSNYSTLANTVKSLSISGKTITVTPGSGSAYTLTTQDTVYTHPTTSGNKHIPSGGSSGQFLGWDSDGTAKWVNNPNTNTDTLMTQNVSTTNATYPVLLVATADATANQGAKTGIFAKSVKVNPSTNVISASGFSGSLTGNVTGNCSGSSGSCTGNAATATQFSANKSVTLTGDVTGTASSKAGWSVATTLANSGVTAGTYGPSADVTGNNNATISVPEITVDAKGRVTSVTNRTLTCKNNTYSVYNKTLTIQKNGTNVATFTSNSNTDVTANITVPTKTSELTNDSGFLTSHQSLSNYVTLNGAQTISATKSFSTAITTASTSTSQRETWGIAFTKTDTNGGGASALGVVQGKNSNDFCSILRLSNPRGNNKPKSGDGVNTGNCWGGIGVYFNFALNRGYPYAPSCDRWADSSNSDNELAATSWVRRYCETTKKFLTSHQSLSNYSTLANTVKSLSISGKTITVTPGSGNAYTLTTQDTVYTHPTTAGNKHIPSGGSSGQILKYSASGTAVWADVSFTRQMASIDTDSFNGASLPRARTVTLTKSQLAVVTVDLTTLTSYLVKLTASNVFVVAVRTLVGTNTYKQDSVNYGCILQQGAVGRTRVVALIFPYNTSVEFTLAKVSGDGGFSSYSFAVYQ